MNHGVRFMLLRAKERKRVKILLASPAELMSTYDVYTGYKNALEKIGVELQIYDLAARANYHRIALKRFLKKDICYSWQNISELACAEIVYQAFIYKPDLVLIMSGLFFHPNVLIALGRAGFKLTWLFTECPYDDDKQLFLAKFVHLCIIDDLLSLKAFRKVNRNSYYLPKACDLSRHFKHETDPKYKSDVIFIGTGFKNRIDLFELINWENIDLKIFGYWNLKRGSKLKKYLTKSIISNNETVKFYSNTKIAINLHREGTAYSANPRVYELAATKTFQISDKRDEIFDVFGDSVVYFEDAKDLEDKIFYFLKHPEATAEYIDRAYNIALKNTFDERVTELLKHLEEVSIEWQHCTEKMA